MSRNARNPRKTRSRDLLKGAARELANMVIDTVTGADPANDAALLEKAWEVWHLTGSVGGNRPTLTTAQQWELHALVHEQLAQRRTFGDAIAFVKGESPLINAESRRAFRLLSDDTLENIARKMRGLEFRDTAPHHAQVNAFGALQDKESDSRP